MECLTRLQDRQQKQADEQKKKLFAQTRETWADGLDPLKSGGWTLLGVHPDGTSAVFGTRRHETRKGSVVAIWVRVEYRETQIKNDISFKSEVERELYDCERIAKKMVSVVHHTESNLTGPSTSYTYDEEKVVWNPVPPSTLADQLLDWACRNRSFKAAKAQ